MKNALDVVWLKINRTTLAKKKVVWVKMTHTTPCGHDVHMVKGCPARGGASNYSDAFLRILAMKSLSLPSKSASSILIILSL